MATTVIAEYLDEVEAPSLSKKLDAEGITAIVKRHGLPRFFGVEVNYKVIIRRSDEERAKTIVEAFQRELKEKREEIKISLSTRCPGCKSARIEILAKNSLFRKIRYFGVSEWGCKECGGRWYT